MNAEKRLAIHYAKVRRRCYGRPPTPKKVQPLKPLVYTPLKYVMPPREGWQAIVVEVCIKHKIGWGAMMMPAHLRKFSFKYARWEAWWRLRHEYIMPNGKPPKLIDIAKWFNLSDHSTISWGVEKHQERLRATTQHGMVVNGSEEETGAGQVLGKSRGSR